MKCMKLSLIVAMTCFCVLAAECSAQMSVCLRCPQPVQSASIGIFLQPIVQQPILIQAVPVQPPPAIVAVPSAIQVQTVIPQARKRHCGLIRRLLSRRHTAYQRGPTLTYSLQTQATIQQADE